MCRISKFSVAGVYRLGTVQYMPLYFNLKCVNFRETGADESEIRVGFVTYHRELHFYNVKVSLAFAFQ